jgi:basic membrane protein A
MTALMAAPIRVGLVTDVGGIDDKSFNQGTWEGIKLFGKEQGLKEGVGVKYLQSTADADYIPNLSTFADEKLDLIVAPGFLFNEAMLTVATQYPNQKFMILPTSATLSSPPTRAPSSPASRPASRPRPTRRRSSASSAA